MSQHCSFQQAIFVKMFRRWSAARDVELDRRSVMTEVYRGPGSAIMAAVACDSLFALVEAHLGRALVSGCCCSQKLAPDEAALLGLLHYAANANGVTTDAAMPHGLSGAICWAARAVRRELAFPSVASAAPLAMQPAHCPFHPKEKTAPGKGLELPESRRDAARPAF
jgi:hypothetical protein